jgi:tetratricopeptide (TPR) repeat protein
LSSKESILKKAQAFMAKGQLDKAISEWEKLISESPNDGNIFNTIGDLHLKKKAIKQSINSYLKAAEIYHESGFDLKTIAVYKKILKIDPKRHDVCLKLGDLNAERGLTGNAISDYLSVAKAFSQEGKVLEAIEVYRKIADLEPENPGIRVKLGEMCHKEGFDKQAAVAFLEASQIHQKTGKKKEAEQYRKKALELDPGVKTEEAAAPEQEAEQPIAEKETAPQEEEKPAPTPPGPLEEAEAAFASGDMGRAETLFKQLIESDPANADYRRRLGGLYLKDGKPDQALPYVKSAFDSMIKSNQADQAVSLVRDYLTAAPEDRKTRLMLASALEGRKDREAAFAEYAAYLVQAVSAEEVDAAKPIYEKLKGWKPDDEKLVPLKSHFEEEAVEEPAAEEEAVETAAAPVSEEKPAGAISEESGAPAPESPRVEVSEPSLADVSQSAPVQPSDMLDAIDLSKSKPEEAPSINDLYVEGEVYVKYGLKEKALEQFKRILSLDPDHIDARVQLKEIYLADGDNSLASGECVKLAKSYSAIGDEEGYRRCIQEARNLDPDNPALAEEAAEAVAQPVPDLETGGAAEAKASQAEEEEEYAFTEDQEEPEPVSARAGTPQRETEQDQDNGEISLEEELEQSFSVLLDESKPPAKPKKSAAPKAPAKAEKVKSEISLEDELEQTFTSMMDTSQVRGGDRQEMEATLPVPPSEDELRQEISLMHDEKAGGSMGEEDYETHYNLGIAYSEMGLINEAIQEFKIACQSPTRSVDSRSMLAVCYRKKGMIQDAIMNLQAALKDGHCTDQERKWLSYDLAVTYQDAGESELALDLFDKLYQSDPSFKDVGQRVEDLKKQAANPKRKKRQAEPQPAQEEDVDAIIEQIMGDSESRDDSGDSQAREKKKSRISYL